MTNRTCGDCTLCCRLLPVAALGKAPNSRCTHVRGSGCSIFSDRNRPAPCREWSCRWLLGDDLPRPDRAGYVVDSVPDSIKVTDATTGEAKDMKVVQVWVDPGRSTSHTDPRLRKYLEGAATAGAGALLRDPGRSIALFAPVMTGTGEWREAEAAELAQPVQSDSVTRTITALADRARFLGIVDKSVLR